MQLVSDQILIKLKLHGLYLTELNCLFGEEEVRESVGFQEEFLEERKNKAIISIQLELGCGSKRLIPGLGQEKYKKN